MDQILIVEAKEDYPAKIKKDRTFYDIFM